MPEQEYPLRDVLNKQEYGLDWQKNGKELFEPRGVQWGLTPDQQRLLFCDSFWSDRSRGEDLKLQEVKFELAVKYLAHFLPNSPEWNNRLRMIREHDAKIVAERVIGNPNKRIMIALDPVGETAIRRDIGESEIASEQRVDRLSEGALEAAFENSRGPECQPDDVLRGNYAYDLIKGKSPKPLWRVLSQDYPTIPKKQRTE